MGRQLVTSFLDRIQAMADKEQARKNLAEWICKHTKIDGRKFSFKDHECHIDVCSDTHPSKNIRKCSQVGLSELSVRMTLGIAATSRTRIIYTLMTDTFAQKFSTDRVQPVINDSPMLSGMTHADAKGSQFKKLGNTSVYFLGTFGTKTSISHPCGHLIHDELDFSNQDVIGTYQSRLRHAKEDPETHLKGHTTRFSTPTLEKFGISDLFDKSDQRYYMVNCEHCGHTFSPSYYRDLVIPGYSGSMEEFDKDQLHNPKHKVGETYIKCEKCGKDLWSSLMNPDRREWVAKYPSVTMERGYQISPWDVPAHNSCPSIVMQIDKYPYSDYINFVIGLPYSSKENSFLQDIFDNYEKSKPMTKESALVTSMSGVVMGLDIGKTAWLTIGVPQENRVHLVAAVQIKAKVGNALASQLQSYIDAFKPVCVVIDAAPDFTTAHAAVENNGYGIVYGCEYTKTIPNAFSNIAAKPEESIVKAARTPTLQSLMNSHNGNRIIYPPNDYGEMETIKEHLDNVKKIKRPGDMGPVEAFINTGPDHYCHSLNYMMIAHDIANDPNTIYSGVVGVLPSVNSVTVGKNAKQDIKHR